MCPADRLLAFGLVGPETAAEQIPQSEHLAISHWQLALCFKCKGMLQLPQGSSGADPSGPIWLLFCPFMPKAGANGGPKAQPNYGPSRDGTSLSLDTVIRFGNEYLGNLRLGEIAGIARDRE